MGAAACRESPFKEFAAKGSRETGASEGLGAGAMRTHLTDNGAGREKEHGWSPASRWDPGELALDEAAMGRLGRQSAWVQLGGCGATICGASLLSSTIFSLKQVAKWVGCNRFEKKA